jgi:hypothetical protein
LLTQEHQLKHSALDFTEHPNNDQPENFVSPFTNTASGGCFKKGAGGKFQKKPKDKLNANTAVHSTARKATTINRYEPTYSRQAAGDSRSFRPKQTVTDCKRSISNLQSSLACKEESHGACKAELKLCQAQLNLIERNAGMAGCGQLAVELKLKTDEANRHQEVARQSKLSKRAADAELERAKSEINSLKEQLSSRACVAQAADKQATKLTALLQQQAEHTRELFEQNRKKYKSTAVQKSRLEVKLADTIVQFKEKIIGINRRNRVDVKNLLQEISALNSSSDKTSKQKEELELSLNRVQSLLDQAEQQASNSTAPIETMKNKRDFTDDVVLVVWELMAMGISENIVGHVLEVCCEHLAGRKLSRVPSKSTASRWAFQSKDVAIHHLGEMLAENADRGVSYATDTTTIRRAERAANVFEVRFQNGTVKRLRGPVIELASHTADEQMEHNVQHIISDSKRVVESANTITGAERISIGYFVRVMGDHVNGALWERVEAAKWKALEEQVEAESISPEVASQMRMFCQTKCSKHKLAKVSRDAAQAMADLQEPACAKYVNMVGKAGRTYECMGYKLTEVVAWQFSTDISVANPHGHAQDFVDWQEIMDQPPMAIFNINKNRHYRHERGARKVLLSGDHVLMYLSDVRDGRDEKEHPNKLTKLGNADSRIWTALHPDHAKGHRYEAYAQLLAMDMLDALFFSPMLCAVTAPSTDVVNVGDIWRAAHRWLVTVVKEKTDAELMAGGREHRCAAAYFKKDKTKLQLKTPFELEFKPPVIGAAHQELTQLLKTSGLIKRTLQYFRAATKRMAAGVLSIASEYFPASVDGKQIQKKDGELFDPDETVRKQLQGFIADNDPCEQQLGDERQILMKAAGKISTTKVSGLNMLRHNNVIGDIRSGRVANILHLRGRLARERRGIEGSEKKKRKVMRARVEVHNKARRKAVMTRAANRAKERAKLEAVRQFTSTKEISKLLSNSDKRSSDEKIKAVKDQLKVYRDLLEHGFKAVPMSHSIDAPAPGGRVKKKKLTGSALLNWLSVKLVDLMDGNKEEHGTILPWKEIIEARAITGAIPIGGDGAINVSFLEECEEPESDGNHNRLVLECV